MFYVEGFNAVGVNQICEDAKVNKSTLYNIFPSKIDLVLEVLRIYADCTTQKFKQIEKSKDSPERKLQRLFEIPFSNNEDIKEQTGSVGGCLVGNIALELASQEERVRAYVAYIFECWTEAIRPIINEFSIAHDLDTSFISRSIIAYWQGAVIMAKVANNPQEILDLSQRATSLIISDKGETAHQMSSSNHKTAAIRMS